MATRIQRRMAVESIESSSRRNRSPPRNKGNADSVSGGARKVLPQPIETVIKGCRNASPAKQPYNSVASSPHSSVAQSIGIDSATSKPRRFAPELIESSRRRRKSTDTCPAVLLSDKTEVSPGDQPHASDPLRPGLPNATPLPPQNSPIVGLIEVGRAAESRFSSSNLRKKQPRQHSFRVPDLPSIQSTGDSESSNESNCPSLSTSPSAASVETVLSQNAHRERNSSGENSSDYLLRLAAEKAEKQLREQAMAAYPNENIYEHVDHFAVDREEQDDNDADELSSDTPKASWGDSRTPRNDSDAGLGMTELRRHHETLEKQRNKHKTTMEPDLDRRRSVKGPFQDPVAIAKDRHQLVGGLKRVPEIEKMRSAASPPMAGEDLRFPLCPSPKQTRLDVGRYPYTQKNGVVTNPHEHTGLWTPGGSATKSGSVVAGLWMGTSVKPMQTTIELPKNLQTGLLTPATETNDPFASSSNIYNQTRLPPSPQSSHSDSQTSHLDSVLLREEQIALEFHDTFVTQVYNYLSLGYPCLAHKFDAELSKISKIPIEDLRQDDNNANAKGYVGAPEGVGRNTQIRDLQEGTCVRWSALRKYVREWARQQSHMAARGDGQNGEWGQRARRGSWAL